MKSLESPYLYRWVFRPSDGGVTLSHDWEDHPAYTRYHGDLADEQWEPNTVFGNAVRITGGWRILDGEHKPIEDPFIIRSVMKAIREQEGAAEQEAPSEPLPADPQRLHYGLPMAA